MLAHNIDLVILLPFFYLIGYFIADNFLLIGLCFGLYVIYHSIFEMTKWRATPGKKLQRMQVLTEKGEEPRVFMIFLRNFLKMLSGLILFGGFAMISWDKKRRALHDRLTGSLVIFRV